jgi:hypothetical protein
LFALDGVVFDRFVAFFSAHAKPPSLIDHEVSPPASAVPASLPACLVPATADRPNAELVPWCATQTYLCQSCSPSRLTHSCLPARPGSKRQPDRRVHGDLDRLKESSQVSPAGPARGAVPYRA